jgi:hypothetical protein
VLVGAVAIGLAACGGSSSPSIANLGTSSGTGGGSTATTVPPGSNGGGSTATTVAKSGRGGSTTTTVPKNNAAALLIEWASCMRSHGDSNQADPVVTTNKLIDINWNGAAIPGGPWGTEQGGHGNSGPGQFCRTYLQAAVNALRGSRPPERPSSAELLRYSECMRANGFPDFPDPSGNGGLQLNVGGAMSPSNPVFQRADKLCVQATGVHAFGTGGPHPGGIELNGGGGLPG